MLPVTRSPVVTWRHLGLVASAAIALLAGLVADAPAKTAAAAIASINQLRVANGIPAVVEDRALSSACQLHAHYMRLNGGWDQANPHGEKPSNPGYTVRGARAAQHSVLAATGWFAPNPWATGPAHLAQVLSPALRRTGYGQETTFICLDTTSGRTTQDADLLTYPGPNATGIPTAITAAEVAADGSLYTPGFSVGLRAGTRTGPYITLFTKARLTRVDAASLTGPAGPVAVSVSGEFVIPRAPLTARTTYTANVTVTTAAQTIQREWQFVTGAAAPEYATPTLALDVRIAARPTGTRPRPKLTISTRGAAVGRMATLRVRRTRKVCKPRCSTRPVGTTTSTRVRLLSVRRIALPGLMTGDTGWSVSLKAPGFTVAGVTYRAYVASRTVRAGAPQ